MEDYRLTTHKILTAVLFILLSSEINEITLFQNFSQYCVSILSWYLL